MQISVKSDVDKALKSMRGLQRKQVVEPAADLVVAGLQATGVGITAGVEYTAEQVEALHKFLGGEGF